MSTKLVNFFWHISSQLIFCADQQKSAFHSDVSVKLKFSFQCIDKTHWVYPTYRQNSLSLSDVSEKLTEFIWHIGKTNLFLSTGKFQHLNLFWKFFFFLSSKKLTKIFRRVEKNLLFLSMCRENSLSSFDTSEKLAKLFQHIDET